MKVLHISNDDKFIGDFIKVVDRHFESEKHTFFVLGNKWRYAIPDGKNILKYEGSGISRIKALFHLYSLLDNSDKIIIHGLNNKKINWILALKKGNLKKCNWFLWGADLYRYRNNSKFVLSEFIRRRIIGNLGEISTYIEGDYLLAKKWYKTEAKYNECLLYTSNIVGEPITSDDRGLLDINVLVGNSGDISNNHRKAFDILPNTGRFNIFCPLSYGNKEYISKVKEMGLDKFSANFFPITEFMNRESYFEFLSKIDIAVFCHDRQQAMGNITQLLSMGKKVYLNPTATHYEFLVKIGVRVFPMDDFNSERISTEIAENNRSIIKEYFSMEKYLEQLKRIF